MSKLDSDKEIIKLAAGLNVDWQQNAVQNIICLCREKISKWLKSAPNVRTIEQLESLVCERIALVFEEVWSDEDLVRVIQKYVRLGEGVFMTLKADLDAKTFATLIERRQVNGSSKDRYVAVVDCRGGEKAARRFFTRWHEIAHILTLQGQLQLPLHRSTSDKSPTERLMDAIAGEVGFYEPFFRPIFQEEIARHGTLNFGTVDRVRERFSTIASFQATLNACVNRTEVPTLVIEVGLGLKREEQRQLNSPQRDMFPLPAPEAKLRVLKVASNGAARNSGLQIHPNIQVPHSSLLYRAYSDDNEVLGKDFEGTENLVTWRHSDGKSLANSVVCIRARKVKKTLIALVSRVAW